MTNLTPEMIEKAKAAKSVKKIARSRKGKQC